MSHIGVLLDTRERHWDQNPFLAILGEAVEPSVKTYGFSWRRAIVGRYDTVHVHWPEYLTQHRRLVVRVSARILFAVWLFRISVQRIPVVKTIHNIRPHDGIGSRIDKNLLRLLDQMVVKQIWLQDPTVVGRAPTSAFTVIPHGDYSPWLKKLGFSAENPVASSIAERDEIRLLCFGILKSYKNYLEPIDAVSQSPDLSVKLKITGDAPDEQYLSSLRSASRSDPRIELIPERSSDLELISDLEQCDIVVAPYPDMFNSGVVLLALSAGRPVAVKENAVTRALQKEFGQNWVYTYSDRFDASVLKDLVLQAPHMGGAPRIVPQREWTAVGEQHTRLYREVCGRTDG